jgi:hypothetical protein
MVVCDYCNTSFYWDKDKVAKQGKESILPESDARLYMQATGKIFGHDYRVVGHVRYQMERSIWDEWYLQVGSDKIAWLSEDERKLSFEKIIRPDAPLPGAENLNIGQQLSLGGTIFSVREKGMALCVGAEGQLPFTIVPDESYPFVDLATLDGSQFATLEYDEEEQPHVFLGQDLHHEQLTIDEEKPAPADVDKSAGAEDIDCPSCGAPLEKPKDPGAQTVVCVYCGSQNKLEGAAATVMGTNPKDFRHGFVFEVGQKCTFSKINYEVAGRMFYLDPEGYSSREYLLFNPDKGYLWLAEENGHYVLNRPTRQAPATNPLNIYSPKTTIQVGKKKYKFFEQGSTKLAYVDGALPWLAKSGDEFRYADLCQPPYVFGVESDGEEVEYFTGEYLNIAHVQEAFKLKTPLGSPAGVHPGQPFLRSPTVKSLMWIAAIFALIQLLLLGWSATGAGEEEVFKQRFSLADLKEEHLAGPMTIGSRPIMKMELIAPVRNAWYALEIALVNDREEVVAETFGEVAYYQGVEGGESWSEGSTKTTQYFLAPKPGDYKILLKGQGDSRLASNLAISLSFSQGGILSRYFLALFILMALIPVFEWTRQFLFEKRRWAPVTGDDDD